MSKERIFIPALCVFLLMCCVFLCLWTQSRRECPSPDVHEKEKIVTEQKKKLAITKTKTRDALPSESLVEEEGDAVEEKPYQQGQATNRATPPQLKKTVVPAKMEDSTSLATSEPAKGVVRKTKYVFQSIAAKEKEVGEEGAILFGDARLEKDDGSVIKADKIIVAGAWREPDLIVAIGNVVLTNPEGRVSKGDIFHLWGETGRMRVAISIRSKDSNKLLRELLAAEKLSQVSALLSQTSLDELEAIH